MQLYGKGDHWSKAALLDYVIHTSIKKWETNFVLGYQPFFITQGTGKTVKRDTQQRKCIY